MKNKKSKELNTVIEEKIPSKVLSFIGDGKSDLPYYISLFLNGAGKSVLLIDNTKEQILYSAIAERNGSEDQIIAYLPDFYVTNNTILCEKNNAEMFDIIIQLWGENYAHYCKNKLSFEEYIFIESSYNMQKDKKLKEFLSTQNFDDTEISLVFQDKVGKQFNEKTIEAEYNMKKNASARYIIPADNQDLYSYQILMAQGITSIKKADLSGGMYGAVADIVSTLYEFSDKEFKQIEKKLLKGIKKNGGKRK